MSGVEGQLPPLPQKYPPLSPVEAAQTFPCVSVYGDDCPAIMRMGPVGKIAICMAAETLLFALLVAVTVVVVTEEMIAGGVYMPLLVSVPRPTLGFMLQVKLV